MEQLHVDHTVKQDLQLMETQQKTVLRVMFHVQHVLIISLKVIWIYVQTVHQIIHLS